MVLLDRLERMGMTELEALDILRELESAGRLATENGRWIVPEK